MTIVKQQSWPNDTIGYIYRDASRGIDLPFTADEIIYIKGANPVNDYQKAARGLSPVSVLNKVLNRLTAGIERSTAMLQNGGVPGILYDKTMDFAIEKSGVRRENYSRFAANPANTGSPYFGSGDMGYLPLGLNMVDMDLAALGSIDFDKICNVYHVSARLFNKDGTGSEVSDDNAHEGLYNHATLPTVRLFLEGLTRGLTTDVPGAETAEIRQDISEIRVLQADQLKLAQAMAASPVIIPNEVRLTLGQDAIKDPLMDKVYIKQGYQALADLDALPPIDERDDDMDEDEEDDES
jgi:phage portal protein BeeE